MACTIAVACQKGGTGKTTTAMTLGAALGTELDRRVLLVDLDPQSSLSISVRVDVLDLERSIYDVFQVAMRKPGKVAETVKGAVIPTGLDNIDILPATIELSNAELELISSFEREKILKTMLAPLRRIYDFIILDCPPSLGILTVNALVAADQVIVPVEADYLAMRGVQLFMETTVPQIRTGLNKKLRVAGILLTKVDLRTIHAREVQQALRQEFGDFVYESVIPQTVKFRDASIAGATILTFARTSPGAAAYREIARTFLKSA